MNKLLVKIRLKSQHLKPDYATPLSSGADLRADLEHPVTLHPGESLLVPTGIFAEIPPGYEIQIRPRSGLALREQITVLNTPGTVDADYRGEIKILLISHGKKSFIVEPGMRIAQMVVCPIVQAEFSIEENLDSSLRGAGGFGHSGTK